MPDYKDNYIRPLEKPKWTDALYNAETAKLGRYLHGNIVDFVSPEDDFVSKEVMRELRDLIGKLSTLFPDADIQALLLEKLSNKKLGEFQKAASALVWQDSGYADLKSAIIQLNPGKVLESEIIVEATSHLHVLRNTLIGYFQAITPGFDEEKIELFPAVKRNSLFALIKIIGSEPQMPVTNPSPAQICMLKPRIKQLDREIRQVEHKDIYNDVRRGAEILGDHWAQRFMTALGGFGEAAAELATETQKERLF